MARHRLDILVPKEGADVALEDTWGRYDSRAALARDIAYPLSPARRSAAARALSMSGKVVARAIMPSANTITAA